MTNIKTSIHINNIPIQLHNELKRIQSERRERGERITLEKLYLEMVSKGIAYEEGA